MTKLFLLGATGHIGGTVLDTIQAQHNDVDIALLVRSSDKAARLKQRYSRVRVVINGSLNVEVLESESRAADAVINALPDQLPESGEIIEACLRGLASRPSKGFYIQTSGAFIIMDDASDEMTSRKVWSDVADIEQILQLPPDRPHQHADQLVRSSSADVNTAIISPTVVYGTSKSTDNPVPLTVRDIVAGIKKLSAGFTISQGRNVLGYIHIDDLADIYARLFADAKKGAKGYTPQLWGPQAYYFAMAEDLTFSEYMEELVSVLRSTGALATQGIKDIGKESNPADRELVSKIAKTHGCGTNVVCRSDRATSLLGWKAKAPSVKATLPEIVRLLV
ncbi:MAG: hypothetical protein M1828_006262 [Chrysothrix sp. TS-e1954]|nr:MAG: hypothetical protein M1828_006262 [Chrysothrix sp. TS-e1954]